MNINWAERMSCMENPAVKAILAITQRSDVISFAGGLPSARAFPVEGLAAAFAAVLNEQGAAALQYGISEGYEPLRAWVADRAGRQGIRCTAANVLIGNGSQQIIDLIARTMLDPGDYVALENPTYLSAVQVFKGAQARFLPIPLDQEGMRVDILAEQIKKVRPKFIYVNPTFQNPTGVTMTVERRRQLAQLAAEHEIPVIEDNPYGELRYSGEPLPAVKSFPGGDWVIYAGTVSKIVAPGLRVGWAIASETIVDKLATAKQLTDVLTNSLTQRALHRFVTEQELDQHIAMIVKQYRQQRDVMLAAMEEHFPSGVTWTVPDGGMFIWVTLPATINTNDLLPVAIEEEKVAYVPGTPFHADDSGYNTMRLNFSNSTPDLIRTGVARLGALFKRHLK
ncbi:PLP-dependent aminotransferase family protein [Sporolituus thermophilus]|uniref:2-aminoadipate transaminase n=1 Tax=Sporolituus thermophilus DSM 23256 TaxID=1123285 RepID=A0A1G7I742_9FIRM|nr:PLP-dependent aminotransferase family protein [Sporolituus thermophilus]SDF08179.1 2-aminoadipate transaminase [Sporolituus thermophilus DSM 23256]